MASISIITTTRNSEECIGGLIKSLEGQADNEFTWIVQDSCSGDDTLRLIRGSSVKNVDIVSEADFSIYDGINRAVRRCKTEYYLVVGSDDCLELNAIQQYRKAIEVEKTDFLAASIVVENRIMQPGKGLGWLKGLSGVASSHSVGLLIKREVHERYGFYSNRFPIVADQYFVKISLRNGATIARRGFVAGTYSINGFSGSYVSNFILEFAAMQLLTERFKLIQVALLMFRLVKNAKSFVI